MPAQTAVQTRTNGNGGARGKKAGNRGRGKRPAANSTNNAATTNVLETESSGDPAVVSTGITDVDVCWICAEPVKYYAVSECNHRTCHVCALRLRALYHKMDCTFCKEPQPTVIFTTSIDAPYSSIAPESVPYKDTKLSIMCETEEMLEETLILLRFNCPDSSCDFIGNGWDDLKLHVRATHDKVMCDLCIRFKKVFAHEHALYPPHVLPVHLPSIPHRPYHRPVQKNKIEGGIHPMCEFCRQCFFGDDELYNHMRENHEECFICKRNDVRDQYFRNYDSLERHFNNTHYPCTQSECLARKFVVFNTPLDLQAHMVEEHGTSMSARDKKDARRVEATFEFEEVGLNRRGYRTREREREREREPPPPPTQTPARRRREGFGAALTNDSTSFDVLSPNAAPPPVARNSDVDPTVAERHAALIARVQSYASNPTTAIPAVRAAIRGYRANESGARDLISTVWSVCDQHLEHTASVTNGFVDLLEDEDKKNDLLSSWKGFEVEQKRQFPDLVPSAVGSGYAAVSGGRVLSAKHATATRSSQHSSRQVWDRVAQAAGSSSSSFVPRITTPRPEVERFPVLTSSSAPRSFGSGSGVRPTAWSASASAPSTRPQPRPQSGASTPPQPASKLSRELFPELPSAQVQRVPKSAMGGNASLRNILGNSGPAVSAWQSGTAPSPSVPSDTTVDAVSSERPAEATPTTNGKGKKGKGKQKQTLFTLGAFPA
ncbi:hypothetical protein FISHEDRAFT_46411 [Fistulina hepatica ATCC 64428]|uniref:RING-type E3 ubiquitin transferase n=1 Tax=Fistulina hepatica ATCC 64428 TaxID=1128425 RepID=A0A0D7A831_9AGAR|nr:hypothetical protein FISHEDRAFT_46411 [Fistulina hepatica ATCC 64428]